MIYLVNTIERTITQVHEADVPEIAGITNEQYQDVYLNDATRINGDLESHFFFYDYETARKQFPKCIAPYTRTVFEIYPGSGRPARVVEENVTVERSREIIDDLCHGNSILEENYAIQDGTVEESTFIDDNGLWQWK